MTITRPNAMERLASAADAVDSLSELIIAEEQLDEVLNRVAHSAARAIPDADAVTITVLGRGAARTASCTDPQMKPLDEAQYEYDNGPCLLAASSRQAVRVVVGDDDDRWPHYLAAARGEGVHASLSVPLIVAPVDPDHEGELVGSLNIYSRRATAFDPFDEELMRPYTATASQAIANARLWQRFRDTVTQLQQALTSRATIDQAKGVIRALRGCSAEEAFAVLVDRSQRENVKLHTIAAELLDSLSTPES